MIRGVEIRIEDDVLDAIADAARNAPGLMTTAYKRAVGRAKRRYLQDLRRTVPGSPKRPIRWKSARQRRAYFASNGFGKGIPYRRTGQLANSYTLDVQPTTAGGVLMLGNDNPASPYVIGDAQQPFHIDTGWEAIGTTANRLQDELTDVLIETWYTVADPLAGVGT